MSHEELILKLLTEMSEKINNIDDRTTRMELHLENITDKNIMLLMEQHTPIINELKEDTERINTLSFDIDNIKRVVISHSNDINKLMKINR